MGGIPFRTIPLQLQLILLSYFFSIQLPLSVLNCFCPERTLLDWLQLNSSESTHFECNFGLSIAAKVLQKKFESQSFTGACRCKFLFLVSFLVWLLLLEPIALAINRSCAPQWSSPSEYLNASRRPPIRPIGQCEFESSNRNGLKSKRRFPSVHHSRIYKN